MSRLSKFACYLNKCFIFHVKSGHFFCESGVGKVNEASGVYLRVCQAGNG